MILQGKTALVTGASRGIGKATAVALAEAGAHVHCVSTTEGGCDATVAACREAGGEAQAFAADIGNEESIAALAEKVLATTPQLNILVNNAGITRDNLFIKMSTEELDDVLSVNLKGTFLLCRVFARSMMKARWGRIVNVSSIVGLTGNAGQANYCASKAGVIGFSKSLARELAGRAVTVNVVAPGYVTTDMTAELPEGARDEASKNIPLSRFGSPQDIAGAVRFLCSDDASYITGQVLVVDGGLTM